MSEKVALCENCHAKSEAVSEVLTPSGWSPACFHCSELMFACVCVDELTEVLREH